MILFRCGFPLLGVLLIGSFWGCSAVSPVPSSLSSPLFIPTAEDRTRLASLTHDLDNRALHCLDVSTCEELRFARALLSLFENQEAARASFRRVIDDNPASALAASSRLWVQLIDDGPYATSAKGPQHTLINLMAQLVREWMTRELTESATQKPPAESMTRQHTAVEPAGVVQTLQKQVRERDRRIATLESKLEALKLIDQDHESRKRTIKLPETIP